jgi:hypothetical protein
VLGDHTLKKTRHLVSTTASTCWHNELNAFGGLPIRLSESVYEQGAAGDQGSFFEGYPSAIIHIQRLGIYLNLKVS